MVKKRVSIFWVLLVNILLIVSVVMFVNLYYLYNGVKDDIINRVKSNIDHQAKVLSNNISTYIDSYAVHEYEKLIQNNINNNHTIAIIVKDKNMGSIISKEYYTTGILKIDNKIVEFDETNNSHIDILKNSYYHNSSNIISDDKIIGTLDIYISDEFINHKLQNLFFDIIIKSIVISTILIIALLSFAVYYFLFRPIQNIINSINDTDIDGIPHKAVNNTRVKEIAKLIDVINNNITITKNSYEVLKSAKLKYKSILDLASDAIFIMDKDGNLLEYSQNTQHILGYSDTQMKNLTIYDWDPTITKELLDSMISELSSTPVIIERIHTRKDGTTYHAQISSTILKIDNKDIIYSATRDITKEYNLRKEIIREKNFISTIIDSANAIIAVINSSGTMTRLNKYGQDYTGYTQKEVSSQPFFWSRFLNKNIKDNVTNIIAEATKGNIIKSYRNTWMDKDGNESMFEWSNTLIKKEDNSFDYIFTIGINIQDKIEAQNKIIEQNKKLEDSEHKISLINKNLNQRVHKQVAELRKKEQLLIQQSKLATMGEMIGHIAHQWRQPLNALSIQKDIIIDDYYENALSDEEIEKFEYDTNELIQYMSKTIDDFRNFFIPSKEKTTFDLIEAIKSVINIIDAQLKNHKITLTVTNKANKNIDIIGYPNEFKQVIINIINNAKDAIINRQDKKEIQNGKIEITIDQNSHTTVEIKDNGGGIPKELLHKVFEPYFTTKFQSKGTGLGLYMSKTIIEINMQGRLKVENIEDGAKFVIVL